MVNGNGNGSHGPLGLVPRGDVPIIGTPITIEGYFVAVNIGCRCDGVTPKPLMLVGGIGAGVQCPRCHKVHVLLGLQQNPQNPTELHFKLRTLTPEQAGASAGTAEPVAPVDEPVIP